MDVDVQVGLMNVHVEELTRVAAPAVSMFDSDSEGEPPQSKLNALQLVVSVHSSSYVGEALLESSAVMVMNIDPFIFIIGLYLLNLWKDVFL
jgi:hypothetical protein